MFHSKKYFLPICHYKNPNKAPVSTFGDLSKGYGYPPQLDPTKYIIENSQYTPFPYKSLELGSKHGLTIIIKIILDEKLLTASIDTDPRRNVATTTANYFSFLKVENF